MSELTLLLIRFAYLAILSQDTELVRAGPLILSFVVSVSCVAIYGHAINDAFDIEEDRQAGKPNAMAAFSPVGRGLLIFAFLFAGFVLAMVAGYPGLAILLLALNYLWPTVYSLPGSRLKER